MVKNVLILRKTIISENTNLRVKSQSVPARAATGGLPAGSRVWGWGAARPCLPTQRFREILTFETIRIFFVNFIKTATSFKGLPIALLSEPSTGNHSQISESTYL